MRADPAVAYVNSTVGTGGPNSGRNSGRMLVALKPRKNVMICRQSRAPAQEFEQRARSRDLFPTDPEHQSRRQAGQEPISVHAAIQRHGDALYRLAPELRNKISKIDGLLDVTMDLYVSNPQVIDVDREKRRSMG